MVLNWICHVDEQRSVDLHLVAPSVADVLCQPVIRVALRLTLPHALDPDLILLSLHEKKLPYKN